MDLRSQQRIHAQPREEAPVAASPYAAPAAAPAPRAQGGKKSLKKPVLYGVAGLLALGTLGLAFRGAQSMFGSAGVLGVSPSTPSVTSGKYQALFLTNGQVYFGKIVGISTETVTLKDIYYLQQNVQAGDKAAADQKQLQLTKLGNELHGPEDAMYVERSQVLFWENLKDDSQVVKKITESEAQKK